MPNHYTRGAPKISVGWRQELQCCRTAAQHPMRWPLPTLIVVQSAPGNSDQAVAGQVGVTRATAGDWRGQLLLDGLLDEGGRGALGCAGGCDIGRVATHALGQLPQCPMQCNRPSVAEESGLIPATVSHTWRAFTLKPHPSETFPRSHAPRFVELVQGIVGSDLYPPERAVVLCVDKTLQT